MNTKAMTTNAAQYLFQSGEIVTVSSTFKVVGTYPAKQYYLEAGTRFPNYDGRAVCWHLDGGGPPHTDRSTENRVRRPARGEIRQS